jgi:squalene-hopene/tetraprenyl-beta-curcumene cyclase
MNHKIFLLVFVSPALFAAAPQYKSPDITIPAASADEAVLKKFSLAKANDYLEKGALAWTRKRGCITCHTTGTYMQIRPMLSPVLGKPTEEIRELFTGELAKFQKLKPNDLKTFQQLTPAEMRKVTQPAEIIYTAAGLAEWDRHVTGKLTSETQTALELMLRIQQKNGTWGSVDLWPPLESSSFQVATVAVMAVATAPGWRDGLKDAKAKVSIASLQKYLRETEPPNDYGGVVLLWAAARMSDLLPKERRQKLIKMLWSHQREDGGWAIRTLSSPEKWGRGNRAKKLRAEPEFKNPPSDGHMTGLAVLVLREAGVPAKDARLQKAVQWLLANQRASGRWWTRSLNTDKFHYITYSGTAYPLLALMKCGEITSKLAPRAKND